MIDMNHKWAKPITIGALVIALVAAGGKFADTILAMIYAVLSPA